jgi:hypothetical protein
MDWLSSGVAVRPSAVLAQQSTNCEVQQPAERWHFGRRARW